MKTRNVILTCAVAAAMLSLAASTSWAVPLLPVTDYVRDAGNAADTNGYGSVGYNCRIGSGEVNNAQYAAFLNDVAKSGDPYGLYNNLMSSDSHGGIQRSGAGTTGNPWAYTPKTDYTNRPVTFVSWYDALRFANYMSNKENLVGGVPWYNTNPTPTEYAGSGLTGSTPGGYIITSGGKDSGTVQLPTPAQRLIYADPKGQGGPAAPDPAYYLLPTENEWYKAAYYKAGGTSAGYWRYPTQSNTAPASELLPGTNNTNGSANYTTTGTPLDAVKFTTPVGAYVYKPSVSAYGTSDQAGNVWEWTETPLGSGSQKILRGGAFDTGASTLAAYTSRSNGTAANGYPDVGFRIIMVPEPSSLAMLLGSAALAFIWWLRKRR